MACYRMIILAAATMLLAHRAAAQDAQVMHWWTSGGESRAVAVFAKEYEKRGGKWIDGASVGANAEHAAGPTPVVGGPPAGRVSMEHRGPRPPARRAGALGQSRRSGPCR